MAVIKCSNCENEILDTDIVCPYCDCPVSKTKEKPEAKKADAPFSDATMKVGAVKDAVKDAPNAKNESSDTIEEKPSASESQSKNEPKIEDPIAAAPSNEPTAGSDYTDKTMKVPSEELQSETLRRSLEERRAAKAQERKLEKKRKDHKIVIITLTIVGIFLIIYLLTNVISNILGEGIFEKEKENKKAEKVVTSEAEMADLGFKFHSHTLTILEQSVLMNDYKANDEKPWKEYSLDTSNLTIASGIETIGAYSFDDLINLTHVTVASSVSSIGESAFYGCSKLEEFALDSTKSKLASIGNYAFTDCSSLKKVTLGAKLKKIGEGAFKSCDSLKEIAIPASVTEIGADAFLGCSDLVIICDKDSYAHEYAVANGLSVELNDDETDIAGEGDNAALDDAAKNPNNASSSTQNNSSQKTDTKTNDTKTNDTKPASSNSQDTKKDNSSSSSTTATQGQTNSSSSTSGSSQAGTSTPPQSSEPSNGSTNLETLIGELNRAATQAEKDKILEQIDKVVGEN